MLMSKQDNVRNVDAEMSPAVDNWVGRTFFDTRRTRERKAALKSEAAYSKAAKIHQSRMRVKAAADHRAAILAADVEAYKAVFEVDDVRPTKRSESDAEASTVAIDRKDPSTWRRPNLDNLKASILAEWKGGAAA